LFSLQNELETPLQMAAIFVANMAVFSCKQLVFATHFVASTLD